MACNNIETLSYYTLGGMSIEKKKQRQMQKSMTSDEHIHLRIDFVIYHLSLK